MASFDRCCTKAIEREAKLKEEMTYLHKSWDSWMVEKEEVLTQEHGQAVDMVAKLDQSEVLRWLAENKA